MSGFRKITFGIFISAITLTIFFGIYMAQPWGNNYAYQDIGGYISLVGFLLFAISPYISFFFVPRLFSQNPGSVVTFLVGASIISAVGVFSYLNAAFLNPDAQGGLIFIFLPVLQWMAIAILIAISLSVKWLGRSNA